MTWTVWLDPLAEAEAEAIRSWSEEQSAGLGAEFLRFLAECFGNLERHPGVAHPHRRDRRRMRIRRFPFLDYLRIKEDAELVEVIAILHSARGPRTIRKRLGGMRTRASASLP